MTNPHHEFLRQALQEAEKRRGFCAPNPSVGAVLVRQGQVVSRGYHLQAGAPHAEVMVLKDYKGSTDDCTLYVTLEPCNHHGRTPPCTELIRSMGIKKLIFGAKDLNPKVSGNGEQALQSAGISCTHVPLPEIDAFYESFGFWLKTGNPFITAKLALSLDGKSAGKANAPVKITGESIDSFTHACRKRTDAILTSASTIRNDNPKLNARIGGETIKKRVIVLDRALSLPSTASVFSTSEKLIVFSAKNLPSDRFKPFLDRGVEIRKVTEDSGGLVLSEVVEQIGELGLHDVWIEAGPTLFASVIQAGLAQRAFIYVGGTLIGPDGVAAFPLLIPLVSHAQSIEWKSYGRDACLDIRLK